jgi:hydroxypyruvate reductase 1
MMGRTPVVDEGAPVNESACDTHNPGGRRRVVVTRPLPGTRWLELLTDADCRVEVCGSDRPVGAAEIVEIVGAACDAVVSQLTERWDAALLTTLQRAGGRVLSNYAVGYDNVELAAATDLGLAVGNTPGILTETTAELAVALTFAAARRIVEADGYLAEGRFTGWSPSLLLGKRLWRKTLGVVGAGRIGATYARMLVEGHKMDLLYYDTRHNLELESCVAAYGAFLGARGEQPVTCRRVTTLDELLGAADVVSLHLALDDSTRHVIDGARLAHMKHDAILVNSARGPLIDEAALVEHCRRHPSFFAALDVFEHEPRLTPGLLELDNVVAVPHLGSATGWTRRGMATLAAANVIGVLSGWPVWSGDVAPFLSPKPPRAAPSIVNAAALGLPMLDGPAPAVGTRAVTSDG